MAENYPHYYDELCALMGKLGKDIPGTMQAFSGLHKAAAGEGALSVKTKELIALGIAVTIRCGGCIAFHVKAAVDAGATREEVTEAIGVAVLMGGGPSVMYGCEALQAYEQFTA